MYCHDIFILRDTIGFGLKSAPTPPPALMVPFPSQMVSCLNVICVCIHIIY